MSVYKTLEKLETVFSAVKWFISTISMIVSTFSVMPGWMEALLMQTSLGRHGQPCMFEMASHETWSCDISLVDFDILKIIKKIPWFSGPTRWILSLLDDMKFHWETWATTYVWNGIEWNWKYCDLSLVYCHDFKNDYSNVFKVAKLCGCTII